MIIIERKDGEMLNLSNARRISRSTTGIHLDFGGGSAYTIKDIDWVNVKSKANREGNNIVTIFNEWVVIK